MTYLTMNAVRMVWKTRDGEQMFGPWCEHHDYETAKSMARQAATLEGWPGHAGGWWNYFVNDVSGWFLGLTKPD